jgi:hypothetical protein
MTKLKNTPDRFGTLQTMPDSVLRRTAFIDTLRARNDTYGNPRGWHLFRDKTGSVIGLVERTYGTDSLRRETEERIGRTIGYGQSYDIDNDERKRWGRVTTEYSDIVKAYRIGPARYRLNYADRTWSKIVWSKIV